MAPIVATSLGSPRQIIDDVKLVNLIESLSRFNPSTKVPLTDQNDALHGTSTNETKKELFAAENDIGDLIHELSKHQTWRFQERVSFKLYLFASLQPYYINLTPRLFRIIQADLHEWTPALDAIDAALIALVTSSPGLVLVANESGEKIAESLEEVESVPNDVISSVTIILRFLSCLLRNSTCSKSIFNSIDVIVKLLGSSNDNISDLAIEVLMNLVSPPLAHHQQTPEMNHLSNPLLSYRSSHEKIMCVARGWGSRGSGLGLYTCVTADNSDLGQGSLPVYAGELTFDYYDESNKSKTIQLDRSQILSSKSPKLTKPTSILFFECLNQAGGRENIPHEKLFPLLSQIRLAKDFYTKNTRANAVERRLKAIICALHAQPSHEVLASYFAAQPELCVEIIDLLRPTISSSSVSSIPLSSSKYQNESHSAIHSIAESSNVPYRIKKFAVEVLLALVSPRDGSNGGNPARLPNVLQELGVGSSVGKGQYLGFLPTLIRFSLASLNTYLTSENMKKDQPHDQIPDGPIDFGIDLGFAFVDAIKAPAQPANEQIEAGVEFIDSVLSLTAAVVSVPHGTASLTDCGLIPALISTIALHSQISNSSTSVNETYFDSLMNHVSAQAIQIIDGAIATNSTSLKVFLELKGIDILVNRLHGEIEILKRRGEALKDPGEKNKDSHSMEIDEEEKVEQSLDIGLRKFSGISHTVDKVRPLTSSRRVLLFCIISCLNCLLHQQESATSTFSGGVQLRRKELTESLIDIMDNVTSYGGALTALTATLLSDVMNSDPQVVHHVHSSGLSSSFLRMLKSKEKYLYRFTEGSTQQLDYSVLPLTAELVMALPNVLSALSLTEDGAKLIKAANPFPALLALFYCPHYVMPLSNCLLNEMSAIVGSGLDELMRHVPSLRDLGIRAIVEAINRTVILGESLFQDESHAETETHVNSTRNKKLENDRTCLMQYAYNISQLLEQILHNEVLAEPFMEAGGLESLLKLYPYLMPFGCQFLSHISCLSNPATANITHSTTTNAITLTIKCIASNYDSQKIIKIVANALNCQVDNLFEKQRALQALSSPRKISSDDGINEILENTPNSPLHMIIMSPETSAFSDALASYLREIVVTEWLIIILSSVIRAACQRSSEMGNGFIGRNFEKWKTEISSESFFNLIHKVSKLHCLAMFEVCRIRSEVEFEELDSKRCQPKNKLEHNPDAPRYRLRIVCQEGAVVRDGIDIDSCSSVGSLQMGEIVEAFDRCINSSGVMRYHTSRGWVSEQTRGHGREPIAEVISLHCNSSPTAMNTANAQGKELKRIEWEVPTLRAASASILGRLQNCQKSLFSCLSRVIVQGVRCRWPTSNSQASANTGGIIKLLTAHIKLSFDTSIFNNSQDSKHHNAAISLYLSTALELLHSCLFEEKRERRVLNVPLLISILALDWKSNDNSDFPYTPTTGVLGAIRFILKHSLNDMAIHSKEEIKRKKKDFFEKGTESFEVDNVSKKLSLRLSKPVAASLPPTLNLLRRLASRTLIIDSQISSALTKTKSADLIAFLGEVGKDKRITNDSSEFVAGLLARELHCSLADIALELWVDPRLACAPAHIIHPITSFLGEILSCLEEAKKPLAQDASSNRSHNSRSSSDGPGRDVPDLQDRVRALRSLSESMIGYFELNATSRFSLESTSRPNEGSNRTSSQLLASDMFEPSEEILDRLTEMGFSREHALEALETTQSNTLEEAMEHALAHPPSSPATLERRNAAREERRRSERERAAALQQRAIISREIAARGERADSNRNSLFQGERRINERNNEQEQSNSNNVNNSSQDSTSVNIDKDSKGTSAKAEKSSIDETKKAKPSRVTDCLDKLRDELHLTALKLIEGGSSGICIEDASMQETQLASSKDYIRLGRFDEGHGYGDGEAEAMTTVLSHFLLELCSRYPSDRSKLINAILQRIKSHTKTQGPTVHIIAGHENDFAALCHAAVIIFRALPRTRVLFLANGMHSILIGSIRNFLSLRGDVFSWPIWLPSVLLLLDVFAQPTAAAIDLEEHRTNGTSRKSKSEYSRACSERKKYSAQVAKIAKEIFSTMNGNSNSNIGKRKRLKEANEKKNDLKDVNKYPSNDTEKSENEGQKVKSNVSETNKRKQESFPPIPVYTPLMPHDEAEICMALCTRILGLHSKNQSSSSSKPKVTKPPPGTVHACLLLLARILRSHRLASNCLRKGGAELLLTLPRESRFVGNTSLVGVVLRHMVEDEHTLRTSMETEIRTTVTRLHRQNQNVSSRNSVPRVKGSSFIQAVIPLICRDSIVFLKAAATTVKVEHNLSDVEGRQTQNNSPRIILLSPEERAKNARLLIDRFGIHNNGQSHTFSPNVNSPSSSHKSRSSSLSTTPNLKRGRARSSSDSKLPKSKTSHYMSMKRGSATKRSKKEKYQKNSVLSTSGTSGSFILLNGSATNHIVSLLLSDLTIVAKKEQENLNASSSSAVSFLRACDYLEILSDLVLAVPACAAAIHRYPNLNNFFSLKQHQNSIFNSDTGNEKNSSSAVAYLIHSLLSQERRNNLKDSDSHNVQVNDEKWKSENEKKKVLFMRTKLAQSTSRLLVALCARAGEGRIQVISELSLAFRGKTYAHKPISPNDDSLKDIVEDKKMWALQSWAELCIGLADPRSNGIRQGKHATTPHFQVVKTMLEHGMGHAIMCAVSCINLHHPMASIVVSALMRPLEVLTRIAVTTEVEKMVEAEAVEIERKNLKNNENETTGKSGKQPHRGNDSASTARRQFPSSTQRSENSFVDDNMLEDGFDPDTAERAQRSARRNAQRDIRRMNFHHFARGMEGFGDDDEEEEEDDDDEDNDEGDVEMEELEEVSVTTEEDDESMEIEDDDASEIDDEEEIEGIEEIEVHLGEANQEDNDVNNNESEDASHEMSEAEESGESHSSTSSSEIENMDLDEQSQNSAEDTEDGEIDHENVNLVDLLGDEEDNDFFTSSGGLDEDDDAGTGSDGELEEGWTRVNSSGFRGVVLGNRQFSSRSNESDGHGRRRRFIIDRIERPDEMLGNLRDILHTSPDMQRDTIQEIEEHLGIRILSNHRPNANATNRTARSNANEDLNSYDRGAVGVLPSVHQPNALTESNHLSGYNPSRRWNENSSMEYTYGSGMIRIEHLNLFASGSNQRDVDSVNMPSVIDTQLFPGGTAAAMHSRAQQHLHPLLSDIELPPVHSVSSTVEPHSIRMHRINQSDDARLLGELSFGSIMASGSFLSSSNGNIIRLNRNPHWSRGLSSTGNGNSSEARWTADGQPLDNTTREFAHAFESVLQETISRESNDRSNVNESSNDASRMPETNATTRNAEDELNVSQMTEEVNVENSNTNNARVQVNSDLSNATGTIRTQQRNDMGTNLTSTLGQDANSNAIMTGNQQATNQSDLSLDSSNVEGNNSEGEAVASSLAAGLRLSPRSESSANLSLGETTTAEMNSTHETPATRTDHEGTTENQIPEQESQNTANVDNITAASGAEETSNMPFRDENPETDNSSNSNGLTCPPGMDLEVFNSLPVEVQREVVEQHQATLMNVMEQLDSSSGLDPEALAALPEDMQREAIAQEQQQRRREQSEPANPSNAQEMDNASFLASLSSPELRAEVLLDADEAFLNSLPPEIVAEVQMLRETRSHSRHSRASNHLLSHAMEGSNNNRNLSNRAQSGENNVNMISSSKRRQRTGKVQVKFDRVDVIYVPSTVKERFGPFITENSMKTLLRLIYLLSPISNNLLENLIQNLCTNRVHRYAFLTSFVSLLNDDIKGAVAGVHILNTTVENRNDGGNMSPNFTEEFPPSKLIGTAPEKIENDPLDFVMSRRKNGGKNKVLLATYLPTRYENHFNYSVSNLQPLTQFCLFLFISSRHSKLGEMVPPEVAKRIIETLTFLAAKSTRMCLSMLVVNEGDALLENQHRRSSCLDLLLNLFDHPLYSRSSTNLEKLLILVDIVVAPLKDLPKFGDMGTDISKKDLDAAAAVKKEWILVPQPHVSHKRLQSLCSVLRLETCKDSSLQKVNMIARRLCRVRENRSCVLRELAYVAQSLGKDAIRDLKMLSLRLNDAVTMHKGQLSSSNSSSDNINTITTNENGISQGLQRATPGSAVALSTSTSELKLLRVLQTLQSLCAETSDEYTGKKNDSNLFVTQEMLSLLNSIDLGSLWDELMSCLKFVLVLEGVSDMDAGEKKITDPDTVNDSIEVQPKNRKPQRVKKLQNSAAGLLTRFLPAIEAFFLVNASHLADGVGRDTQESDNKSPALATLVDGDRLVNFVSINKVLLNALLRSNPSLLERGLQSMIQVPQCRPYLDFDVKRHWFKTQLRRHRNRRGTLKLNIQRNHVFEDTYRQISKCPAEHLKWRLHITFKGEEGVDAGGLSREFFGILAKEMFNPNYALFTSTEDGCTFQPNPNSSINPDHLSFFRVVGRIVGKALVDGFLMDAHFTRSLYKHMLGIKVCFIAWIFNLFLFLGDSLTHLIVAIAAADAS